MKRFFLLIISVLCLTFFTSAMSASAAFDPFGKVCDSSSSLGTGSDASTVCAEKDKTSNPLTGTDGILIRAARFITLMTGIASIIIIIYGALKYITSGGDSGSVNSAKSTILYAVVGLVLSLLSQGIIVFVINSVK